MPYTFTSENFSEVSDTILQQEQGAAISIAALMPMMAHVCRDSCHWDA
jgi:hypothetical protein